MSVAQEVIAANGDRLVFHPDGTTENLGRARQPASNNVVPFPAKSPLERALWLAAKGFSVFPLQPGTKDKYFNDASDHGATKDPELIRQLFAQPCNVGIWLGSEFVAICPDLYRKGAPEAWAQLLAEVGPLPLTFTTASAQGGEHYIFRTGGRIFSQSSPWKKLIDIRAAGGYVLAPGSTFITPDGTQLTYGLKHDADIPVIPDKAAERLALRAPKPERMDSLVEPDQPGALARGWQLVEQTQPATEGERNNATYKLAGLIKAQGVSEDACCEMVLKWNEGNAPPLDSEEVEKAVESSYRNGDWRVGEHDPKRHFGAVEAAPFTAPLTQQAPASPPVKRMAPVRADTIPERQINWLRYPYFPSDAISLIGSRGGTGKGLFMSAHAAPITTGGKWPLSNENAPKGRVFWAEAEDPADKVLIPRWRAAGVDMSMVDFVDLKTYALEELKDYVRENRPRMLVFSPFLSFLGDLTEPNNEVEVRKKLQAIQDAIEGTGCAAIGICHINKKADQVAIERLLGSVAFANYVRSALMLNIEDESTRQVRVVHSKFNWSPKGDDQLFTPRNIGQPRGQEICLDFERPESNVDSEAIYDRKKKDGKLSCPAWLEQYLKSNSRVPKERVISDGQDAGYSKDAIEKAHGRHERMHSKTEGFPGKAIWWLEPG